MDKELVFVCNANPGIWNAFMDSICKVGSPQNYLCSLCKITHDKTGVKKEWNEFINNISIKTTFLHRNEWNQNNNQELPSVFISVHKTEVMLNSVQPKDLDLPTLIYLAKKHITRMKSDSEGVTKNLIKKR